MFGVADEKDLEEEIVFVDIDKGLGIEGVEGTSQGHQRLQLADVVHFLCGLLQDIVDLLLIEIEIRHILALPQQSEVDQIIRILLDHLCLLLVEGEVEKRGVIGGKERVLSMHEDIRVDDLADDDGHLVDDCLVDETEIVLVIPQQRAKDHEDGTGIEVEVVPFSDLIEKFGDGTGEDSSQNGVIDEVISKTTRSLLLILG